MLRSRVAVWQVSWCYVAGRDLLRRWSWCAVQQVGFSGQDLRHYMLYSSDFRSRSRIAVRQVGFSGEDLRRRGPYSSDFRRRPPAKNRTCGAGGGDLRHQMGSQHYRSGRPATLYALQQRFPSPVPGKESDLRHQGGRPATPEGETCGKKNQKGISKDCLSLV